MEFSENLLTKIFWLHADNGVEAPSHTCCFKSLSLYFIKAMSTWHITLTSVYAP